MLRAITIPIVAGFALTACGDDVEDCEDGVCANCPNPGCPEVGGGGTGASGAMGGAATTGGGGTNPGGGGTGGMPDCMNDSDCTDAANAQCDGGTCVPCTTNPHCDGVAGAGVCDAGECVECMLGDEGACVGGETCDLIAKQCVAVAPMSVGLCAACTNDVQCGVNRKCIPLDYPIGTAHGHFCLEIPSPGCTRPYTLVGGKTSISGEPAATYCGTNEALATCEVLLALQAGWFCTVDGMCSEAMGGVEVAVPSALCRDLFGGGAHQAAALISAAQPTRNVRPEEAAASVATRTVQTLPNSAAATRCEQGQFGMKATDSCCTRNISLARVDRDA